MLGEATPVAGRRFVVALRAKGETPDEVTGLVEHDARRRARITVAGPGGRHVGTGGDRAHTVNISTMAAMVVAGTGRAGGQARQPGGVVVLRRRPTCSRSSASWSTSPPAAAAECAERAGIAFCFAPLFHPALRHAGAPRRELGVPTVFNFLGPLANPAQPPAQAVGVRRPADGRR